MQIISADSKDDKEIKMIPEMLNLLGCSKDNFKKLLQMMGYRLFNKGEELYFRYKPIRKFKKTSPKKITNENPFKILKDLKLG